MPLSPRQQRVALIIHARPGISSSRVLEQLAEKVSLVTVKRDIALLLKEGYLISTGSGPSVAYELSLRGRLFLPLDAHAYCAVEPDKRLASAHFNFDLFPNMPETVFTEDERALLEKATIAYRARSGNMSKALHEKELERFVIELSWKSSRIEGNTYTLLDTERLIREGIEAPDHSRAEATMIVNHKRAFDFVRVQRDSFARGLDRALVEEVHRLLVEGLGVSHGVRTRVVGITGTAYRPLGNPYQIREALKRLYARINSIFDPYSKALVALAGLSYVQPFEDGNKRAARLIGNALLLGADRAPLSYRSVDEVAYREAIVVFYEVQSIEPLKKIFIEQYLFSAAQYAGA
ncbi:hypothetical protein A3C21_02865 [Candidatus Kaiserbacteria bacterium RIFCSPHIGHO2_02_FULL_59_21]|uniref:Fido domain-containing protein n=1 Tax=Candidatus Kaiserbacteria bacterium RIFCSPHIGHO2_02_FULL_59_21 TaxID=1798500 RepID=A0A1F6DYU7_9BACT|nr:MAG: hypothetical protein A3C21_02865 [Candidatus Kaiserbacteria bacterium RIFCSPHIGHO2_02_FULL_59_21]OGG79020.1 MAG: hypothetical protein A2952_01490 [Candidatus Kaiserbacteria bacterium RIFCSPLOWO2_01_FULL_59_34]OGG84356.1 MAG: hypothetical protein A3I47_01715 [Candidatus Kaiserbacteria bacterium RIFCSPLOWO2_02_FULL_59_19]